MSVHLLYNFRVATVYSLHLLYFLCELVIMRECEKIAHNSH